MRIFPAFLALLMLAACGGDNRPGVPVNQAHRPVALPLPRAVAMPKPQALMDPPVPLVAESTSLWADWRIEGGWKVQRHYYSGIFRLIDPAFRLWAQGDQQTVQAALSYLLQEKMALWRSRKVAFLVHGLASSEVIWGPLAAALTQDGWQTVALTYPSTEQGLTDNGLVLRGVLERLDRSRIDEVAVVAHSLGGLVVRSALAAPGGDVLPLAERVVMLGTPNQGSTMADLLRPVARMAVTASANDLRPDRAKFLPPLAKVVTFGVVAGGRGANTMGYNPLLSGDDDGVVRVAEARAANMDDFIVLPVTHTGMAQDPAVIAAVRRFLRTGRFQAPKTAAK